MFRADFTGPKNVAERFNCSELEAALLKTKAEAANLTKSEYIRELICSSLPTEAPPKEFYLAVNDINKIGINLNQIAKMANTNQYISQEDIEEVKAYAKMVIDMLADIKMTVNQPRHYSATIMDDYAYAKKEAKKRHEPIPEFGDDISMYIDKPQYKDYKDFPERLYKQREDEMMYAEENIGDDDGSY
ncbi:MAG: MobC family plasmid mobilization relaxosome protein [Eubacterium sp.]|nr:MobC family plasmid mobilization relaxosome protein [Eubacterium sp.]